MDTKREMAPGRGWLWGWASGVVVAALVVLFHAGLSSAYLTRVSDTRLRDETLTLPLQRIPAAEGADGMTWIRHALALSEGGPVRLRHTLIDNAPGGRDVHWNSAWAWWLDGLGHVRARFTGEPLAAAIEHAAAWAQVPLLLTVIAAAAAWVGRRQGGWAGALCAVALAGQRGFYEGFLPGFPDHHGLINASLLGLVLGAVFMGAGWWREGDPVLPHTERQGRNAAWISGLCGGCALWISAASACVPIALIGIAGAAVALGWGPVLRTAGAVGSPGIWRLWGRVGAAASLFFYLLEYAPGHLAMRLEVNHPLYSLAWLAGGEGVALAMEWREAGRGRLGVGFWARGGLALLGMVAPMVLILIGREAWFAPADPFLARVHSHIDEFKSLWSEVGARGWIIYRDHLLLHPLIFVLAAWSAWRAKAPARMAIVFAGTLAGVMTLAGWFQLRWMLTSGGAQVALMLVLWSCWTAGPVIAGSQVRRGLLLACLCGWFYATGPWMFLHERVLVAAHRDVQMPEVMQLLYRDIARRILADRPAGDVVLLASPNASTAIGYYGRFRSVGTLYWENRDGLRAAADMFCAPDAGGAAGLVRARGVTHVVMVSAYNFIEQYYASLYPGRPLSEARRTFGGRLLYERNAPAWLRPLPYEVPSQFARFKFRVDLYAVDFGQPPALAFYRTGIQLWTRGDLPAAEASFEAAQHEDHPLPQTWLRRGELQVLRKDFPGAVESFAEGIARSPADKRLSLYQSVSRVLVRAGAVEEAVRLGRRGIAAGHAEASIPLARVLATTRVNEQRDGVEALRLARDGVRALPTEASAYEALAAALAETGNFAAANGALFQATEWAEARGDAEALKALEREGEAYRAGRAWRE